MPETGQIRGVVRTAENLQRQINASFDLTTFNAEDRTVEVVFATDASVLMGYYERYYEVLSFEPTHVRMERLNSGAPLLDQHNRWVGAAKQPGVVDKAWLDGNKGRALVRFSKNADGTALMDNVKDKIVRNVSFGYNVYKYEEIESAGRQTQGAADSNKIPTYRAIDWEGTEISFVTIPADYQAGVRGTGTQPEEQHREIQVETIFLNKRSNMSFLQQALEIGAQHKLSLDEVRALIPQAGEDAEKFRGLAQAKEEEKTRAAANQPAPPAPAAAPAEGSEYARELFEACEQAGLTLAETRAIDDLAKGKIEAARKAIIAKLGERSATNPTPGTNRSITVGGDERDKKREAMETAMTHRVIPETKLENGATEYRGMSLLEMAREALEVSGVKTRGMNKSEIAKHALGIGDNTRGAQSTSDFPLILSNVMNKVLLSEMAEQPDTWRQMGRQKNATDFKAMTLLQMSESDGLDKIQEAGEYKRMSFQETGDTHRVFKYGKIIPVTWEAIVNDDLNAIDTMLPKAIQGAKRTQADIVYDLILGGAANLGQKMYDGQQLFHSSHSNVATGAAIAVDAMGLMRKLLRKQKGMKGKSRLNIEPAFLLGGPDNEQLMLQYLSAGFVATENGKLNPWAGTMKPIIESRMDDYDPNAWYMIANPKSIETFVYSFLEGHGEVFTENRIGFDVDGLETKVRMVFGAKVTEWRGFAKNPNVS